MSPYHAEPRVRSRPARLWLPLTQQRQVARIAALGAALASLSWVADAFVAFSSSQRKSRIAGSPTTRHAVDYRIAPPADGFSDGFLELGSAAPEFPWAQLAVVLLSTAVPAAYWWYIVVPNKRREMATSKRRGDMKEFLVELAAAPADKRKGEKWFYDKYMREAKLIVEPRPAGLPEATLAFEADLQKALPGGGFWSFDNPVFVYLVAFAAFCLVQIVAHALNP
ncbi:unnamed protein product [Polarella glacialis]|uniref:Uncharacterized protein n=1 Tax=Polarella glacialis TaxID=89957 RepID=A0A813DSS7_POLGL|nr:unnamed protein product [Polarella glacialis]|mmetsp:Transcript_50990/g.82701  ORF Transcript_50990/g.82701 Transcript_50990/m.82701 type:complete len:224 (-) Transcript_50990:24-695(-)